MLYVLQQDDLAADGPRVRQHLDDALNRLADTLAVGDRKAPDRSSWGLLPHQVAATTRAMNLGGESE